MKRSILFNVLLVVLVTSCGIDITKNTSESCYSNTNVQTIDHDGIEREYVLYLPDSYTGSSAVALMLNFHGFGDSATNFMETADMRTLAELNNFILVYPQGSCADGSSHWNPCPIGGDNKSSADDVGFVEAVIAELASQYNVDLERVYACGYSNGGMMAYGLANYKSDMIAGVASVSGAMLDCTADVSHSMPVIHLHGTSDGVIPYDGGEFYSSVQSTLDHWIDFNNTSTSPIESSDNSSGLSIEHFVYDQGDKGVLVEHYKYIGGDHIWFDTNYEGKNASELIWNFLSKYDINGLR